MVHAALNCQSVTTKTPKTRAWLLTGLCALALLSTHAQARQLCMLENGASISGNIETVASGYHAIAEATGVLPNTAATPSEAYGTELPFSWSDSNATSSVVIKRWATEQGTYIGQYAGNQKLYQTTYYTVHTFAQICYVASGCTTQRTDGAISWEPEYLSWGLNNVISCMSPVAAPVSIQLEGSRQRVNKPADDAMVDMVAKLSIGGFPYANQEVTLNLSTTPIEQSPGRLLQVCPDTGCPGQTYRTNAQGVVRFQYQAPQNAATQVDTIRAHCLDCTNEAAWPIQIGAPDIVIGFFNGVSNTRTAAQKSLDRLETEFGPQYKDSSLKYDWFYNQTDCNGGFCLEDMAETFEQRSQALNGVFTNRWETFWDILAGRHQQDNSFTGRLLNLLGNGGNALLQWRDTTATAVLNQLVNNTLRMLTLFSDSPTSVDRADHNTRLWKYADDGSHMLLVAHSQGNLFVNSAYDALKKYKPEAKARVVHVAPAAPTLRGDHVLADIDLVINALRGTGLNSVPDVNINLPLSKIDLTGHSFEPTYLDKSRAAYARTRGLITSSLDALTQ